MPAGPSELLVIADVTAEPKYVISDLLSQAEHGVDSQVVLLTVGLNAAQIENYQAELFKQASVLPRSEIVKVSISKSYILSMETIEEALAFSNRYAPEHLILNVADAESLVEKVIIAGSVFVGPYSPERYLFDSNNVVVVIMHLEQTTPFQPMGTLECTLVSIPIHF